MRTRWQTVAASGRKNADAALLAALAGGATIAQAAQQAGVSERTAHRRLAEPAFRAQLDAARAELVRATLGRLLRHGTAAADALVRLLEQAPPATRLGAARAIIELGGKLRESEDIERRLAALEAALAHETTGGRDGTTAYRA